MEGSKGSCIIKNLSTHLAANERVAQNLLFQGPCQATTHVHARKWDNCYEGYGVTKIWDTGVGK